MEHWWSYSLEDFLLFAPQTYFRLFELYNLAIWPVGHGLAVLGGLAVLVLLVRPVPWRARAVFLLLAAGWIWVAWAYFTMRYASMNWAAPYYAYAFVLQGALLILFSVTGGRIVEPMEHGWRERGGICLLIFALLLQPLIGIVFGRSWPQIEIAGLAPDPTIAASLGIFMLMQGGAKWLLLPIPILWCVITGATLWAMDAPDALLMPLLATVAILLLATGRQRTGLQPSVKNRSTEL